MNQRGRGLEAVRAYQAKNSEQAALSGALLTVFHDFAKRGDPPCQSVSISVPSTPLRTI